MTEEEWQVAEEALRLPPARVELKIDGYHVTITHALVKSMQYCLAIYIDNKFEAKWVIEDTDIRRRFCQKHTQCWISAKDKKALHITDKQFQQLKKKYTFDWYEPYWNSFRKIKAHFIKNNKTIELISAK
ncbi:MAG: hypothetical protein IJZ95_07380 [Oscillospiraceae bacterium]|nr:hypothetical protein [Oscillospiraceae bacterium]